MQYKSHSPSFFVTCFFRQNLVRKNSFMVDSRLFTSYSPKGITKIFSYLKQLRFNTKKPVMGLVQES